MPCSAWRCCAGEAEAFFGPGRRIAICADAIVGPTIMRRGLARLRRRLNVQESPVFARSPRAAGGPPDGGCGPSPGPTAGTPAGRSATARTAARRVFRPEARSLEGPVTGSRTRPGSRGCACRRRGDDRTAVARLRAPHAAVAAAAGVVLVLVAVCRLADLRAAVRNCRGAAVRGLRGPDACTARAGKPPMRRAARLAGEHTGMRLPPARVAARRLLPFIGLVITWRLPAVLDALARYPCCR